MRSTCPILLAATALLVLGCPKAPEAVRAHYSGPPKAFKPLSETPEAETSTRLEKRTDLLVTVESGEPVPSVVAVGETPALNRQGGTLRLYGDAEGKQGWSVDNFVLLEVVSKKGEVLHRAAIGFQQGCSRGSEVIDALGQMKFAFGPGEIELSNMLPADEQVTVKATALDTGGVGKVSDLYMILTAEAGGGGQDEDMREK
jgi:hypothetical protein